MKTQPTGPFLGINNRLPDFALAVQDKGRWLREADNVEITNSGNVVRRKAATLVQAMTAPHSLYKNFLVRASTLYTITLPTYSETLLKVLTSNAPMSYVEFNGDTYYSNGTDSGRVSAAGVWYPWALPTPDAPASSVIGGSLLAGTYQIAVSYTNSVTGEEGGISASSNPTLASDGGLRVTLPAATPGATHINVYVSTVNGEIPFLHSTVATGTATVDLTTNATGRESNQRFESPLPAGTRVFMFNGRLCSVSGKELFYSIPHRLGYALDTNRRIRFEADISIAIPNQMGLYVAAGDMTYFFQGTDIETAELVRDVLPYGAVPGTEFQVPNKPTVGWFGHKGLVLADTQGQAEAITADAVDVVVPASGVSTVLQSNGFRRVVSCGYCVNIENAAVSTYSNWDFTSTGNGYGTAADGIYLLEGTGKVDAHVSLGKENFGVENMKHMPAAYLGVSSDEPMEMRATTPDHEDYRYEARNSDVSMKIQRIDPGKGLRANWFELSIYNVNGSDFTLATASFAPVASGRRI